MFWNLFNKVCCLIIKKVYFLKMSTNYGLNEYLEYTEYQLDSQDAIIQLNGTSSLDWPNFQIPNPQQNTIAAIKVLEVSIPFSYYVINSGNNTFLLTDTIVTDATVTIPVGNYTSTTWIAALDAALLVASNTKTWTTTYSSLTGKTTTTSTVANTFTFTFPNTATTKFGVTDPRLWIGFNAGANASVSNVMTSPNVLSITGPQYLYVNSSSIGGLVECLLPSTSVAQSNGGYGPQIARIPVNVNPGGTIQWQDPDPLKWFDLENALVFTNIDIYLTMGNSSTKPLALNGLPFSIKLGVLYNAASRGQIEGYEGGRVVKRIKKN